MPHNGNLSSDEGYGQHVGTFLAKQLFHLVILDKGLWLTAQIVAFHLYALILQHIDERGDAQQILVYTGTAYSRGATHGWVENLNLFHGLLLFIRLFFQYLSHLGSCWHLTIENYLVVNDDGWH